jgi:hypothetical protein
MTLAIEVCSVTWTPSGSAPDRIYQCADNQAGTYKGKVVLAATQLHNLINNTAGGLHPGVTNISANETLTVGATDHLLFTFTLPSTAASGDQGQSSTYGFKFSGTQRTGSHA